MLFGSLTASFGWRVHVGPGTRPTTLRNFRLQADGAEMMRLACVLAAERGLPVCCPVHDALLVEAPLGDIEAVVAETRRAMREASELVLPGFPLRTEAAVFRWPGRFEDKRGRRMWATVWGLIGGGGPENLSRGRDSPIPAAGQVGVPPAGHPLSRRGPVACPAGGTPA
jgi:hypothetical protein